VLDKSEVRNLTKNVAGLSQPKYLTIDLNNQGKSTDEFNDIAFPCIVKPCTASGKIGVSLCCNASEFVKALDYAALKSTHILVEQFIQGVEVSVETISHAGKHYVVQITDKENTGAPHFVEIAQHEPSQLKNSVKQQIKEVVKGILNAVEYDEAVAHIEMKIDGDDIYLIEINPRGGGSCISTTLIELSTGYDYLSAMIDLALGKFVEPKELFTKQYSGLYWLTGNNPKLTKAMMAASKNDWVIESHFGENIDKIFESNVGRDSYVIYKSDHKITVEDCPKD
jgi:biotin carboxylase